MKKVAFCAAAAALCGSLLAVESANIVGYQNRALVNDKFVWCCGTFQAVGVAQSNMKLGDVSLANDDGVSVGEVTLSLISGTGSNLKLTSAETTKFVAKSASFVYLPQAQIDEAKADPDYAGELDGVVAGWYHETDDEFSECFNNYVLPFGTGYAVKQTAPGYTVLYAGNVVEDVDMPSIALQNDKFVWTGNAAPKDMTLGDFSVSNPDGVSVGDVTLSLISGTGSNLKLTSAETTKFVAKSASFVYLPQEQIDEAKADPDYAGELDGVVAGWYHETDDEFSECFNSYPIPAGLGFAVKQTASGYSIDLPGAL